MKTINDIKSMIRNSLFNKQPTIESVDVLGEFKRAMVRLTDPNKFMLLCQTGNPHTQIPAMDGDEIVQHMIPGFQRDNNKWDNDMKLKYVENILMGYSDKLLLFTLNSTSDELRECMILDGLQRTTAIMDMLDDIILPFGHKYSDFEKNNIRFNVNLSVRYYVFDEWKEVGEFYIHMNENITHSPQDIQKARDWFLKEKNIII